MAFSQSYTTLYQLCFNYTLKSKVAQLKKTANGNINFKKKKLNIGKSVYWLVLFTTFNACVSQLYL